MPLLCTNAVSLALAVACGDSTAPGASGQPSAARYYGFVSAGLGTTTISGGFGDLILRPNGSYVVVVTDLGGGLTAGHWDTTGTMLRLRPDSVGYDPVTATISGDTIRTAGGIGRGYPTLVMRFARTAVPAATSVDGVAYALRTVNGVTVTAAAAPLAATTTRSNARTVTRVAYDTLFFSDRLFAHESRALIDTTYPAGSTAYDDYRSYSVPGRYVATSGAIVVQAYAGYAVAPFDTLALAGDTLVRRYRAGTPSQAVEERYVRLR